MAGRPLSEIAQEIARKHVQNVQERAILATEIHDALMAANTRCFSCGELLSSDCPNCQRLWQS